MSGAEWTNLWRFYHVYRGNYASQLEQLHREHGPVVQTGPNIIDADLPELIRPIFNSPKGEWRKVRQAKPRCGVACAERSNCWTLSQTIFYNGFCAKLGPVIMHNVFSTQDPTQHADLKRPVGKFYAMPSFLGMEGQVDRVIQKLCDTLVTRFSEVQRVCDLSRWFDYCEPWASPSPSMAGL
jgi:hypothetical protein